VTFVNFGTKMRIKEADRNRLYWCVCVCLLVCARLRPTCHKINVFILDCWNYMMTYSVLFQLMFFIQLILTDIRKRRDLLDIKMCMCSVF